MEFTIEQISETSIEGFRMRELILNVSFSNGEQTFHQAVRTTTNMTYKLVDFLRSKMNESDKISLQINHDAFLDPIDIPFVRKKQFTAQLVIDYLLMRTQSYKDISIGTRNSLVILAQIQSLPRGGGRRALPESEKKINKFRAMIHVTNLQPKKIEKPKTRVKNLKKKRKPYVPKSKRPNQPIQKIEKMIFNKKSIIKIYNNDKRCLLRSIIVAKDHHDFDKLTILEKKSKKLLTHLQIEKKVKEISNVLNLPNKASGIYPQVKQIEAYLKNYSISIYESQPLINNKFLLHEGPVNRFYLYILFTGSHYHVIKSMKALFNYIYFCNYCKRGYRNKGDHWCIKTCKSCKNQDCVKVSHNFHKKCKKCKVITKNDACLRYHTEFICNKQSYCNICGLIFYRKKHVCLGEKFCVNCQEIVREDHKCYLSSDKYPVKAKKNLCFFDYESFQVNGKHIANLVVAELVCIKCLDNNNITKCLFCESKCFWDNNSFCDWVFSLKDTICLAHNFRSFDGILLLENIYQNMTILDRMPKLLLNGSKILSLEYKKVKFIDSLSFLPMALEKFSKTFDLKELKKGFFCHGMNSLKNKNYFGKWPDREFYNPDFMTPQKKVEFEKFYLKNKDRNDFDFKKEIYDYCFSDVQLLKEGCLAFRSIIKKITLNEKFKEGIDPFTCSITIASLTHFIFRNIMLEKNTIGIINDNGYNSQQKHSKQSIVWLEYIAKRDNIEIQHARNKGEMKIGDYLVDGWHEPSSTCYEYFGCWYHSCRVCFNQKIFNTSKQMTMASVRILHDRRINLLKKLTYNSKPINLVSIWECDFLRQAKINNDLKSFFIEFKLPDKLNPRHGFYGGRTEVFMKYYKAASHQKIKYLDFCSLYPYTQKYKDFPLEHPEIIISNFKDISEYFGLVKLKILAPRNMYIPILPTRVDGKLLFALCSKCANNRIYNCKHSNEERAFVGTWCTEEVKVAVKKGYRIIEMYEVWHFAKRSNTLFKSYIDMFLKLKQQASGFPENVKTQEEKEKYVLDYFNHEQILLDIDQIFLNPGMRAVMKLLLNSMWGKLGQKADKTQYKVMNDPNQWIALIDDDNYQDFTNGKYIQVFYKNDNLSNETRSKTNIVLACFITAYARLNLYNVLEKLDRQIIYSDTDSIIYWVEEGLYDPPTGENLGDLTNEISKEKGNHIVEVVAIAEKCYGYKTDNGYTHALAKGITFNNLTSLKVDFECLKEMVLINPDKEILVDQLNFIRNNKKWTIKTEVRKKMLKNTFSKRQLLNNCVETVPFGY